MQLYDINSETSSFSTIFQLTLEWHDLNLKYNYLKDDKIKNSIDSTSWYYIWKPDLNFGILTTSESSLKLLNEEITIRKDSTPSLSKDVDELFHNETFEGSKNPIILKRIYQGRFVCDFDGISSYPFGTNTCYVRFYLTGIANEMVAITNVTLTTMETMNYEVGSYYINQIYTTVRLHSGLNSVGINFELLRSRGSIIMVTYLPTFLMNMINQVPFYFSCKNCNNVNIPGNGVPDHLRHGASDDS